MRDQHSKEFLIGIGVDEKKIFLSTDPVINLRKEDNSENYDNSPKKVCFSLRNWKDSDVSHKISEVAEKLIDNGMECHFIPFYYKEDLQLIDQVEKILGNKAVYYKEKLSTNDAFDIIKTMDVMVGVRLHSLIFAAAANVPIVAVSYDHKVDHFVNSVNMKIACTIDEIDENKIYLIWSDDLSRHHRSNCNGQSHKPPMQYEEVFQHRRRRDQTLCKSRQRAF